MRLGQIADQWVRELPLDEALIRRVIREQADEEGLLFDARQIRTAIRRAWNRLPDEERNAAREGIGRTPGPYNQDQDEDKAHDQDQTEETAATNGKRGSGLQQSPAPPSKISPWSGDAEIYDLLERHRRGQLRPAHVELGPMPPDATESMVKVARDIALLIGLRLAVDDDRPLIYATSFCAWRMGWATSTGEPDKPRASRVLRKLIDAGVIEYVGTMPRTDSRLFAAPSPSVRRRPRPQPPAVGVQPRVEPFAEVEQQRVVHEAEPVGGEHLGVVATGNPADP